MSSLSPAHSDPMNRCTGVKTCLVSQHTVYCETPLQPSCLCSACLTCCLTRRSALLCQTPFEIHLLVLPANLLLTRVDTHQLESVCFYCYYICHQTVILSWPLWILTSLFTTPYTASASVSHYKHVLSRLCAGCINIHNAGCTRSIRLINSDSNVHLIRLCKSRGSRFKQSLIWVKLV